MGNVENIASFTALLVCKEGKLPSTRPRLPLEAFFKVKGA